MNYQALIEAFTTINWKEFLLALVIGLVLGFIFAKLKLPAMSPLAFVGVVGIFALWAGYTLGS
jgi:XapX domain-containing protein